MLRSEEGLSSRHHGEREKCCPMVELSSCAPPTALEQTKKRQQLESRFEVVDHIRERKSEQSSRTAGTNNNNNNNNNTPKLEKF